MEQRHLGPLSVSAIGLGCMGMSHAYGGQPEAASIEVIHRAIDLGVTFFDTAEVYGPFENEILLGRALRGRRDKVVIATKFGFRFTPKENGVSSVLGFDSRPEHVRDVAEASLKRLGIDHIDLFYQHRVDPDVPVEDTVGALADLVKEGKIRAIGLSEAPAEIIRRAHAIHPVAAVQSEYSLWTRDPEAAVLPTCTELGIGFVPFSPLGRGLLSGAVRNGGDLSENDFRKTLPRFSEENLAANVVLADALARLAEAKGCTSAQLVLAWVLAQGRAIVPIPGVRKLAHLEDNVKAAALRLSAEDLAAVEAAVPVSAVHGGRYPEGDPINQRR
ncbi:aldo/keto reductase [Telmatospirillum siberiense]|uniref:Aldo/keto reductase n=1 Tax=Telmatospirillum siberiense TaxID=382514 RepID=A0A2N3PPF3_9PROT|nr:aldo/keto reductase [Telmatospirillum siberiense]PKU22303.1 aldo/keto reductase [Telmatospirillum siberiense]